MANINRLKAIGQELLPVIAYGDAAGVPVETKSHDAIAGRYGRIDKLIAARDNPFYIGEFTPGTWSDDTQLSMAVVRALVRAGTFDMQTIAEEHVAEYNNTPQVVRESGQMVKRGWGGSTTRAVERYMNGVPIEKCGEPDGAGNGVIMKMAPLAYWLIAHETDKVSAYRQLDAFTTFTHDSPVAQAATRLHYDVLKALVHEVPLHRLGEAIFANAWLHEEALGDRGHLLSKSLNHLSYGFAKTSRDILNRTDGKGFYVPQTLAMAYDAFSLHRGEFNGSVYEAVNLGGDTDSIASIVATMSLFYKAGIEKCPVDFDQTLKHDELVELSRKLVEAAT